MKPYILTLTAMVFFFVAPAQAKHLHHEKYYQNQWCKAHGGQVEGGAVNPLSMVLLD